MLRTILYLIRHAQSEGNAKWESGLGHMPKTEFGSDLTKLGVQQARDLATELEFVQFSAIYSSHLKRAKRTAHILKGNRPLEVRIDHLLREREEDEEQDAQAISRFIRKLDELILSHEGQTIAIVSHGFAIRGLLDTLGITPLEEMPAGYIQNTGYLLFEVENQKYQLLETKRVGKSDKV